jgi:hypothetical protein
MNVQFASIGGAGGYGEGTIIAIAFVIVVLLYGARRRRSRRLDGELEGKSHGLPRDLAFGLTAIGETVAVGLAWLLITHVAMPIGIVLGVVFGTIIGASVFAAVAGLVSGIFDMFKSFFWWVHSELRNASIAAASGFAVGFIFGSLGRGILLAGVVVGIVVGRKSGDSFKRVQSARASVSTSLAAVLGISEAALNELMWSVDFYGTITVQAPGAALLNADRLADRVATLLPHLEVSEMSVERIVLSPVSDATDASRAHVQRSGGLVTGATDAERVPTAAPKNPDVGIREYVINLEDLQ